MARSVWTGSISFGLVNVPVKAYTAVRDHDVHFNQLEKGTGARIRYEKVSAKSGKEVEADDIELGYEVSDGRYVTFERSELDELQPESTRAIRSEEHTSELQSLMRISYAVFCLKKKNNDRPHHHTRIHHTRP